MGELVNIVTGLHRAARRDYLPRMVDDKIHCMEVARRYGPEFWDGDRRYGYAFTTCTRCGPIVPATAS